MRIFHRIDDVNVFSNEIKEIIDFFENNTKEYIIAAIPNGFDIRLAKLLKELKRGTVFQHGFSHENHVINGWCDEFPESIDYNTRKEQIEKGKTVLETMLGYPIIGYVPPWNNTSKSTMRILNDLGFKIYSAQDNNTIEFISNKDIQIDIVKEYKPIIKYKNLDEVYYYIESQRGIQDEIGILYHFNNIKSADWERIQKFVLNIEEL